MHVGVKVGEDGETFHGPLFAGGSPRQPRARSVVATEPPSRSLSEIFLPHSTRVSGRDLLQRATPRALTRTTST
jgi:hypothetical protein